jgi:hypothetical protein
MPPGDSQFLDTKVHLNTHGHVILPYDKSIELRVIANTIIKRLRLRRF